MQKNESQKKFIQNQKNAFSVLRPELRLKYIYNV